MPTVKINSRHSHSHQEAVKRLEQDLARMAKESGTECHSTTKPDGTRSIRFDHPDFNGTAEIKSAATNTCVSLDVKYQGFPVPATLEFGDKTISGQVKIPLIALPVKGRIKKGITHWIDGVLA